VLTQRREGSERSRAVERLGAADGRGVDEVVSSGQRLGPGAGDAAAGRGRTAGCGHSAGRGEPARGPV